MRGGEIEVRGSAGAYLGKHLCGGSICIFGDAGDFAKAANQDGTIFIGGKHLSARRKDEQRNYNRKRRGQGSAQLPEDGNRAG